MPAPYLLIPVGLGVLISYFFSHLLLWFGIITKINHRRFWNIILLITFFVTALLGILLAIQINFKLEWTAIDKFLSWHVNFGIAMSLVAIIHFLWHIDYYLKLFRKSSNNATEKKTSPKRSAESFRDDYLVVLTGFTATILQVLLLRELTTLFQGNEIMMTWTIGIWMVLTGTGSYLGKNYTLRRSLQNTIQGLLFVIAVSPAFLLILLVLLKNVIFLPGVMISPGLFIILVVVILTPVCLISGMLFSLFVRGNTGTKKGFIGVYLLESLGSIFGGIIVSFLLINWFSVLQSVVLLATFVSTSIYWRSRRSLFVWISGFLFIMLFVLIISPVELKLRSQIYSGNKLAVDKETYYGNLAVTGTKGEYNFFLNGSLLFNTGNYILREEFVHYAMLQHENPESVLIVSGGVAGMTREILKYPSIRRIDYLEINSKLVKTAEDLNLLPDTSILHISHSDISSFLSTSPDNFDIAIIGVPDPSSVQLNRYYSDAFINKLKTKLNPGAVIIYGLASSGNYMSQWQNAKLSIVYNTLAKNFKYIEIIPGDKDYMIASEAPLSNRIGELSTVKGIENEYVNEDYMDDGSIELRGSLIEDQINPEAGINTNERALPVFYSTLKYLSHFHSNALLLLGIPMAVLFLLMFPFKKESRGMYITGFTGASVEVILIFVFQIAFGYIYAAIGILIAIFMAGLALGAYISRKITLSLKSYRISFLLLTGYLILLFAFLSVSYSEISQIILWPIFIVLMLIPSTLTGIIFVISTSLYQPDSVKSAPAIYAVDLIGSSLGMIIMTLILIPVIGLNNACIFLGILNLIPILFSYSRKIN